ncbi:MAG: hypothetical protein AABZ32_06200 [Bacteroidota bacterium]
MNTVRQTAQSLFIMYNYLPEKVRQEFNNLLKKNPLPDGVVSADAAWLKLSEETLSSIWETPENEIWDEYYLSQKESGNV